MAATPLCYNLTQLDYNLSLRQLMFEMQQDLGQDWIIDFMQALGYESNEAGICYGWTYSARDALCAEERALFDKRFSRMRELYTTFIKPMVKEEKKALRTELEKIENMAKSGAISYPESVKLHDRAEVKALISIKSRWTNEIKQQLSKEQQEFIKLEVEPFLVRIGIYYWGDRLGYLYEHSKVGQDAKAAFPLVATPSLEKKGIYELGPVAGSYTLEELCTGFLKPLYKALEGTLPGAKAFNHPVFFSLGSLNHSIGFSYDPSQKSWIFINPCDPLEDITTHSVKETKEFKEEKNDKSRDPDQRLAQKIFTHFNARDLVTFDTNISVITAYQAELNQCFSACQNNKFWKKAHQLNENKRSKLLFFYAESGNLRLVKEILAFKNIEQEGLDSALLIAAQNNQIEIIKELLKSGAQNNCIGFKTTPLNMAIANKHMDAFNIILRSINNPEQMNRTGSSRLTTLHFAVNKDIPIELIQLLLEKGADPELQNLEGENAVDYCYKPNVKALLQEHIAKSREHYTKAIDHICNESQEGPETSRRKALDKLNQDKIQAPTVSELKYTLGKFNYLDSLAAHFTKIAKQFQYKYPNESAQVLQAIDTAYLKFSTAKISSWDYKKLLDELIDQTRQVKANIQTNITQNMSTKQCVHGFFYPEQDKFSKAIDEVLNLSINGSGLD